MIGGQRRRDGRKVAVKFIPVAHDGVVGPRLWWDNPRFGRIPHEVQMMLNLGYHKNLAVLKDIFKDDTYVYIVSALIQFCFYASSPHTSKGPGVLRDSVVPANSTWRPNLARRELFTICLPHPAWRNACIPREIRLQATRGSRGLLPSDGSLARGY